MIDPIGVPGGVRTLVCAVKAGGQTGTVKNYRNTDALDGVPRAVRNKLMCPRCVPGCASGTVEQVAALSAAAKPTDQLC